MLRLVGDGVKEGVQMWKGAVDVLWGCGLVDWRGVNHVQFLSPITGCI